MDVDLEGFFLRHRTFPAVKIARLAIDKAIQGKGFGGILLDWAVNHIRTTIMPHVGCRFVVVDSKLTSVSFYQQAGFVLVNQISEEGRECPMLFYDLANDANLLVVDARQKDIVDATQLVE
jgi:GNAT superfamily N-acetyltransferase